MSKDEQRAVERAKYESCYNHPSLDYHMGGARMNDAVADVKWAIEQQGCKSYLDVGCGCAEMLDHAMTFGFDEARGTDIVDVLCKDARVDKLHVHELHRINDQRFDFVTSFDVIEHLIPGDDELLLVEMSRIARRGMAITANNRPSVDPHTQNDLHINKRHYDEWDRIIRDLWEPDWMVQRMTGKEYISETWRAWR